MEAVIITLGILLAGILVFLIWDWVAWAIRRYRYQSYGVSYDRKPSEPFRDTVMSFVLGHMPLWFIKRYIRPRYERREAARIQQLKARAWK